MSALYEAVKKLEAALDGANQGGEPAVGDGAGKRVLIGSRRFPGMYIDGKGGIMVPANEPNGARLATENWVVQRDTILRELDLAQRRIKFAKLRVRLCLLPTKLRKVLGLFRYYVEFAVLEYLERLLTKGNDSRMVTHIETPN